MAGKKTSAIQQWDKELAEEAQVASDLVSANAGGQFFNLQGGQLSFGGAPLANNQMAVVVIDYILENVYYPGKYDPENRGGPKCFAFGRTAGENMVPHAQAAEPQSKDCETCPHNEWGSADTGRGKACKNTMRLAMISAGSLDINANFVPIDNPEHFETDGIAYMRLPVTSVKGFSTMVTQVAGVMKRPPYGIFSRVHIEPDAKSQFKVLFEPLDKIGNEVMGAVMTRHKEAMATTDFPYTHDSDGDAPKPKPRAARKGAAKKRKY